MKIYKGNIETETLKNTAYRKVIFTTRQAQLVFMNIPTGEEIGAEVHPHTTQFIRVESGCGVAYIGSKKQRYNLKDGDAIIIPAGVLHNVKSTDNLKLYTIYSPPEHKPGTIEKVKQD